MNKYIISSIAIVFTIIGTFSYVSVAHAADSDVTLPVTEGFVGEESGPVIEGSNAPETSVIVPETNTISTEDVGAIIPGTESLTSNEAGSIIPNTVGANDDEGTLPVISNPDSDHNTNGNGTGGVSTGGSSSSSSGSSMINAPLNAIVIASCPLITDYLKLDGDNDPSQVTKLQAFLKNVEKMNVDVSGIFDTKTEDAVKSFQIKYLQSVLGPWDATRATGFVYITTLKKINEIACATAFTLSAEEQAVIDAYKRALAGDQSVQNTDGQNNVGTSDIGDTTNVSETNENVAAVGQSSVLSRFWKFIVELFR